MGSDFLILLLKKSGWGNFRVSDLDGLRQKLGPGFSELWAYVVRAQYCAWAYGLGPWYVPALEVTVSIAC